MSFRAPPRWRLKEIDKEMLRATAIVSAWSWDARGTTKLRSVVEEAEDLRRYMSAARDASMARSVPGGRRDRQQVYWWTPEIAEMQESCLRARRRYLRARRRRLKRDKEEISCCYETYRELKRTL